MPSAKQIVIKPIASKDANKIVQALHYSGKTVQNSQLHLGVFLDGKCGGALQFGPSLDKRKIIQLVRETGWNQFIELNRMALAEWLPRNGESRSIAMASRFIAKHYPHIKWCVSFADGTQCGDGTIYRASGFILTGIHKSYNLAELPSGDVIHKMTLESSPLAPRAELDGKCYFQVTGGRYDFKSYVNAANGQVLPGFQLRYIKFFDDSWRERLAVPSIPFSKIDELGASMYRGERPSDQRSK